jgi:tetratricopeptide (TPR) repeat protein
MDAATVGIIVAALAGLIALLQLFIGNVRDYKAEKRRKINAGSTTSTPKTLDKVVPESNALAGGTKQVAILPRRPKPFVNRTDEIKIIEEALKSLNIVQLRALGGIGKTVLAIEVAYRLKYYFSDGVVHLSAIDYSTLEDILNAVANAFDIPVGQTPLREKKAIIHKAFQSKQLLLIFDNVEQFEPIETVLNLLPTCAALITSRPPYLMPKVILIEPGPLPLQEATHLFELNAGKALSNEQKKVAADICFNLGAFPLAIELAARHIQISKGNLRNLAQRIEQATSLEILEAKGTDDRSVRASFLYTYRDLSNLDKELFGCLGTFGGSSFSLAAIKAISGSEQAEEGMERLVARSLVKVEDNRYSLHPLLKLFARENLNSEEYYKRMARYFSEYASENSEDFAALEVERANMQEAINWSFNHGEKELVIQIVQALLGEERDFGFLAQRGYWNDALIRIQQAIEASRELNNLDAEGHFLSARGLFHYWFGNYNEARADYRKAEENFTKTGNDRGLMRVYWQIGYIEDDEDNYAKAEELYREGLALSLKTKDSRLISTSRELVGCVLYHRGKYEEARQELQESLSESISLEDKTAIARTQRRLAGVARRLAAISSPPLSQTYIKEARSLLQASLEIERNQRSIARLLRQFGLLEQSLQNYSKAKEYFHQGLEIFKTLGAKKGVASTLYNLGTVMETEGNLDVAERYYNESLAIGREINMRSGMALNLLQLASVAHRRGDITRSLEFATQAVDILTAIESLHLGKAQKFLDDLRTHHTQQESR